MVIAASDSVSHISSSGSKKPGFPSPSPSTGTGVSLSPSLNDFTIAVEPFRHDSVRRPTVDIIVRRELLKVVGSRDRMHEISDAYFASISRRISIISAQRFYSRLPSVGLDSCTADYAALCLSICILLEVPQPGDTSMQSSLYITLKSILSLLEATSYHSLESVQCRILMTFYELGHGIYSAASASMAACAKIAQFAFPSRHGEDDQAVLIEERRRTIWALHNFDRCVITVCISQSEQ